MTTTALQLAHHTAIFDTTYDALLERDVHDAMNALRRSLATMRASLAPDTWKAFGEEARRHPLHRLLLESPFSRRAYAKPRGYAGDAGLMDLIYGTTPPDTLSALGGMLYAFEFDSPCCRSVRARRAILAREIDEAATRPHAHVIALACGHLREVEWSRAAQRGSVQITAVDQDRESLDVIDRHYASHNVSTVQATVGDVLRRSVRFGDVDLAYAAGLYDYLPDEAARALTTALFRMLRPGGRLLIANFTPAAFDAAFMEAMLDWHLVYTNGEIRIYERTRGDL